MEDVHGLRVFLAVADSLSFTRAAETLFLTQSAVSHQIARLERTLGTPLLVRAGRAVSLTPAGKVLVGQARRVFAVLAEAEAAVKSAARPDLGRLRIGASSTACQLLLPDALREFRESFPNYSLSVTPGDSPLVAERLLDGTIDVGVMVRPDGRQQPKLVFHDLFTDTLGLVVSPLHAWAQAGRVPRGPEALASQKFVLYARTSATFRMVERQFLRLKAPLQDPIELGSIEAIKELVKLGLGVSVLAGWVARRELAEGSLVWLPLPGPALRRAWCVATTDRPLSLAEQTFVGLCAAVAAQVVTQEEQARRAPS